VRPRAQRPCAPARGSLPCRALRDPVRRRHPAVSVVSWTPSAGATLPSALLRTHAPILPPLRAAGRPSATKSWQVAVSPCGEEDLPDVLSAQLSRRAWPSTPAARVVPRPVSSHTTAAFPPFGPGRRSTRSVPRFPYGALCEAGVLSACSGPQVCAPPRSLLPLRCPPQGSRGFSVRASRGSLPPHAPDMLTV
jgi:hypothetical protein